MNDRIASIFEKYDSLEDAWCKSRGQEKVLINMHIQDVLNYA